MSEHEGAEVVTLGKYNRALLDILDIYAQKNNTGIYDVLRIGVGLPMDDIEAIYNNEEISEENRRLIDEWIKDQRALHSNVLSSQKDEIAARRIGKSAIVIGARTQTAPDEPSDFFPGDIDDFLVAGPEDVHRDDGPIDFFDD